MFHVKHFRLNFAPQNEEFRSPEAHVITIARLHARSRSSAGCRRFLSVPSRSEPGDDHIARLG